MKVSLFAGDITDAPAHVICTSTNPRLSLMMGTGGELRDRGGFDVLRACERIIEEHKARTGEAELPAGTAWLTTAGRLPFKAAIHCIASDRSHHSSAAIIRSCVTNALDLAAGAGHTSIAMPVFATGHAAFKFEIALAAMGEALMSSTAAIERVIIVVYDADREADARRTLQPLLGDRLERMTRR